MDIATEDMVEVVDQVARALPKAPKNTEANQEKK
jgi:hypothetical protein